MGFCVIKRQLIIINLIVSNYCKIKFYNLMKSVNRMERMFHLLTSKRQLLCHFVLSFFLINILLSLFVAINYINILPNFHTIANETFTASFVWFFLIISFIAQAGVLFLFFCIPAIVLVIIFPRFWIAFLFATLICSALVFVLIIDSIIFNLYHMHYASVGWEIFKVNAFSQVISLTFSESIGLIIFSMLLLLIESLLGWQIWQHSKKSYLSKKLNK